MAKFNIDNILSELGVDDTAAKPARHAIDDSSASSKEHSIDKADKSFSPLPALPANQRHFDQKSGPVPVEQDPAVRQAPEQALPSTVGPAFSDLYNPEFDEIANDSLSDCLLSTGAISAQQLSAAQKVMKQSSGVSLIDTLIEQGGDEIKIQRVVADVAGVPFERIDLEKGLDGGFDGTLMQRLGIEFCKKHLVIPLRMDGARVAIGATKPDDVFLMDQIHERLGVASVKLVLVIAYDVRGALEIVGASTPSEDEHVDISSLLEEVTEDDVQVQKVTNEEVDLEKQAGESPVIRYVNYIIQTAIKEGASDIHIEPAEKKLKVRFRIDGVLFEMMNTPASMAAAITSRLKIMANLDISERRLPQDGRIRCVVGGRKMDLRMSTLPSTYGEKTVMRILDTRSINVELTDLGFEEQTLELWSHQIHSPHGIVLVTGPTGSGKTTTLYSSLRQLDKNKLNISTVEDPVEYHLDGVTQTQMHEKIGMTFSKALKALLRQDPDVIMLGEIRDTETASIAIQAAMTGHLVLSTLHTNDAPSSITRLVNIGIEPFLVGGAVNSVLAQRLVRKLCESCKQQEQPSEDICEFLQLQGIDPKDNWAAKGCEKCRDLGYAGRVGIYELLVVDDQLRDIIAGNPNVSEFRRLCIERGMVTLRNDGMRKVSRSVTTVQEVLRVTEANA